MTKIIDKRFDDSINGWHIDVTPYRTDDVRGYTVEVYAWYQNGGMLTAEGYRVKRNGEVGNRRQACVIHVPEWVKAALNDK